MEKKIRNNLQTLEANDEEKFISINRLGSNAYENVDTASTYAEAVTKLESLQQKRIIKSMQDGNYHKRSKEKVSLWIIL